MVFQDFEKPIPVNKNHCSQIFSAFQTRTSMESAAQPPGAAGTTQMMALDATAFGAALAEEAHASGKRQRLDAAQPSARDLGVGAKHRRHLRDAHVPQALDRRALILELVDGLRGELVLELPQCVLVRPHARVHRLGERQHRLRQRGPASSQRQFEQRARHILDAFWLT